MSFKDDKTPVWEPVTLSDTAAQNYYGLLIGGAGNVVFKCESTGSDITLTGVSAGMTIPGRIVLVKSTGTTAAIVYGGKAP